VAFICRSMLSLSNIYFFPSVYMVGCATRAKCSSFIKKRWKWVTRQRLVSETWNQPAQGKRPSRSALRSSCGRSPWLVDHRYLRAGFCLMNRNGNRKEGGDDLLVVLIWKSELGGQRFYMSMLDATSLGKPNFGVFAVSSVWTNSFCVSKNESLLYHVTGEGQQARS